MRKKCSRRGHLLPYHQQGGGLDAEREGAGGGCGNGGALEERFDHGRGNPKVTLKSVLVCRSCAVAQVL